MRFSWLSTAVTLLALLPGCGGEAIGSSELPPGTSHDAGLPESSVDAPAQDSAIVQDGGGETSVSEASPDVAPTEFCTGNMAKLQVGSILITSPPMTTSPVIMDCCDGVVVRFHVKPQLGYNISLMVQAFGSFAPGSYVVGDEPGGLEASVHKEHDYGDWVQAKGTVHVDTPYPEPRLVGFCLETPSGDALPPLRMYVPQVLAAPFEWDNRWGLYLLNDPAIKATDALKQPIGSLALQSQPVVHVMSMAYYEQGVHKLVWDDWYSSQALLSILPQVGLEGLPFVAMADGERVYVGAFITPISSFMVDAPSIDTGAMPEDGFSIVAPPMAPDPRSDPRIIKVLSEAMKLAP